MRQFARIRGANPQETQEFSRSGNVLERLVLIGNHLMGRDLAFWPGATRSAMPKHLARAVTPPKPEDRSSHAQGMRFTVLFRDHHLPLHREGAAIRLWQGAPRHNPLLLTDTKSGVQIDSKFKQNALARQIVPILLDARSASICGVKGFNRTASKLFALFLAALCRSARHCDPVYGFAA